jgi:phosphoglycolate phosphatase
MAGLVIFDWSGVISDDRKPVYEANMRILEGYGMPKMSFDEWLAQTTMTVAGFLRNLGIKDDSEKLFAVYEKCYNEAIESGIEPEIYPNVHDVVEFLKEKRKRLAVLSSHPTSNLEKEAEDYNLTRFFDLMVGDSRNKANGLLHIYEQLKENLDVGLYVGDTIYDIRASKKAGVHSAAICCGYHSREKLAAESPNYLLETLLDLKSIF